MMCFTTLTLLLVSSVTVIDAYHGPSPQCRLLPHDPSWPSPKTWSQFNTTIHGNLITTTPLASACHIPQYSPSTCNSLKQNWTNPLIHYTSSSSIMAPFFANRSCDAFTPTEQPCELGNYIAYAVNVTETRHVQLALRYAKENNLRVVVRNTGHDYNGKSTGAGALGIWMHNLKDIVVMKEYSDQFYSGPAIKMGAGVQGFEAYAAADGAGLRVVGGECPTVGIAGGYAQGGGHSALSSRYGLAADQVLSWDVVDGRGRLVKASPMENQDLYWALSGGGGGTFGVVVAMTVKAHWDGPVSAFNVSFAATGDALYEAVATWHEVLPSLVDRGAMSVWYFTNTSFSVSPLTAPDMDTKTLEGLVSPFLSKLEKLGIEYQSVVRGFGSYLEEFQNMQTPIQVGIAQYGGWLIPRSVVQDNNEELTAAYRRITEDGATFIGVGVNVSKASVRGTAKVENAVLPAWRDTLIDTVITTTWNFTAPWSEMLENQRKMTEQYIPQLSALAPDSGCYLNEGDFQQPDWQRVFYGENYDELLRIKDKYDPNELFYAITAVGADRWSVGDDGRMCRNA